MSTSATVTVGLVLAAGGARRFGATKQVAELDGLPLVGHAVATAHAAGCREVLVVVGHDAALVAEAAATGGQVRVVHNPAYAEGQATSLGHGLDAAEDAGDDVEVAVVLLADQPNLRPDVVRAVADAAAAAPDGIARAAYDDGPGHPVGLHRRVWPRLQDLTGDEGARQVFAGYDVALVSVRGPVPPDVDRPADLERLRGGTTGPPWAPE
jgi:CTP:molybdopterin cytidylyltransferase MocA